MRDRSDNSKRPLSRPSTLLFTSPRPCPNRRQRLPGSNYVMPPTPDAAARATSTYGSSPHGSALDARRDQSSRPLASLYARPAIADLCATSRSDRPRPDDGVNAWSPQNSSGVRSVPFRGGGDRRRRSALDDLRRRPDEIGGSPDEPRRVGPRRPHPERRATAGHASTNRGTPFDNPCQRDSFRSCPLDVPSLSAPPPTFALDAPTHLRSTRASPFLPTDQVQPIASRPTSQACPRQHQRHTHSPRPVPRPATSQRTPCRDTPRRSTALPVPHHRTANRPLFPYPVISTRLPYPRQGQTPRPDRHPKTRPPVSRQATSRIMSTQSTPPD